MRRKSRIAGPCSASPSRTVRIGQAVAVQAPAIAAAFGAVHCKIHRPGHLSTGSMPVPGYCICPASGIRRLFVQGAVCAARATPCRRLSLAGWCAQTWVLRAHCNDFDRCQWLWQPKHCQWQPTASAAAALRSLRRGSLASGGLLTMPTGRA